LPTQDVLPAPDASQGFYYLDLFITYNTESKIANFTSAPVAASATTPLTRSMFLLDTMYNDAQLQLTQPPPAAQSSSTSPASTPSALALNMRTPALLRDDLAANLAFLEVSGWVVDVHTQPSPACSPCLHAASACFVAGMGSLVRSLSAALLQGTRDLGISKAKISLGGATGGSIGARIGINWPELVVVKRTDVTVSADVGQPVKSFSFMQVSKTSKFPNEPV
jgi:hypothetical protein